MVDVGRAERGGEPEIVNLQSDIVKPEIVNIQPNIVKPEIVNLQSDIKARDSEPAIRYSKALRTDIVKPKIVKTRIRFSQARRRPRSHISHICEQINIAHM